MKRSGVFWSGVFLLVLERGIDTIELAGELGSLGVSVDLALLLPAVRVLGSGEQSFLIDLHSFKAALTVFLALDLSCKVFLTDSILFFALSALIPDPLDMISSKNSTGVCSVEEVLSEKSHEYNTPSTIDPCSL